MHADNLDKWAALATSALYTYVPRILLALLVLAVGLFIIKLIMRGVQRMMAVKHVDHTLQRFLSSLVGWGLKILLFVSVIQMLGVATTSFVAIIGAAGLAVGLALQGTLANFAGGVLILLFRPYKVGDLIEAQGVTGHVKEIQIFTTTLLTPENKLAMVPNGAMANGNIINYSAEGRIRVDLTFGVAGDTSISEVRRILVEVMKADPKVLGDPVPGVTVSKLNPEGTELAVRPWCAPEHYWDVYYGTYERGQEALRKAGVQGPRGGINVYSRQ
ncbi:MAG: mechanosensitive ion channel [Bacteroidetes bacterium]|nr:mechanosensitive ion channel [Bacteroidota bacterium]MBS1943487.1 mechanosensitive ion channel [Bacteroidota bacterium]